MSSGNTAVVDRIYQAFEVQDLSALFSALSPDIEIIQVPDVPWGGVFRGADGARSFFTTLAGYLEDHVTIEKIIDGGDRVAVIGHGHGVVRSNGRNWEAPIMHLWEFRDGLVVRLEIVIDVPTIRAALIP